MVAIAFWLFVLAAVGQVFYGVLALTVSPETARTQSSTAGDNPGRIDLTLQALTVLGFVLVLGAVIVGGLSWRIRRGDPRARRAMVALCVPLVLVELGAFYLRLGVSILLPVVLIVASVLLFRPAADEWFVAR